MKSGQLWKLPVDLALTTRTWGSPAEHKNFMEHKMRTQGYSISMSAHTQKQESFVNYRGDQTTYLSSWLDCYFFTSYSFNSDSFLPAAKLN